jgi:hypothetical protein
LNFLNIRIFDQILIVRLINFEINGRNALQNTASGGGAFFPHQRALQNAASGGGKIGSTRASGLQRAETAV